MFAELHLDTGTTHLYDWFKKQHDQYEKVAGVATCYTAIMCTDAYVCPRHTVTHSRCTPPAAPLQDLLVVLRQRCVGLCLSFAPALCGPLPCALTIFSAASVCTSCCGW